MKNNFIIKGDICYSKSQNELNTFENKYLICKDGISMGVFDKIPTEYNDFEVLDYSNKIVVPGLIDLHVHAPQYTYRGLGMDLELLEWLNTYTFPEESKYQDLTYAKKSYEKFVNDLKFSSTTRASVFSTLHVDSTILLMDLLEESGMVTYVGKVNMDRNGIDTLQEKDAAESESETIRWLTEIKGRYKNTFPILTPRFTPSCTDDLMARLGEIEKEYKLPVQSHLSENQSEIAWVKKLSPKSTCYGDSYDRFHLFGDFSKTIMAHCVWSTEEEQKLLRERGVFIAHCPNSNLNLASGIAPIRKYLEEGQNVGLGSDIAGGIHLSIFKQMSDAIQVSKMYWRLVDKDFPPLTIEEAFYLGTIGGGKFFENVGSFDKGFEFDAVVIDDSDYRRDDLTLHQRLERTIYISDDRHVIHKFIQGSKIF